MINLPDRWVLLKINSDESHYRIYATWSGGYLDSDSWKMNSGVTKISEDETYYYFTGSSGSIYQCNKSSYGINSSYGLSILNGILKNEIIELIEHLPNDIMAMDWLI